MFEKVDSVEVTFADLEGNIVFAPVVKLEMCNGMVHFCPISHNCSLTPLHMERDNKQIFIADYSVAEFDPGSELSSVSAACAEVTKQYHESTFNPNFVKLISVIKDIKELDLPFSTREKV